MIKTPVKPMNIIQIVSFVGLVGFIYLSDDRLLANALMSGLLILAGIKTVIDFIFKKTMRVGYSGDIEYSPENRLIRGVLLALGVAIGGFGLFWLLYKVC